MEWWFRAKGNGDPALSAKLIGRIVLGQMPDSMSVAQLHDFFEKVPLPVMNTDPQQSCVTWNANAISALQSQG
ncbi:hypothetical protein HJFPF1_04487 [Paramyrothecium foliicola]|nr:hypothetical protein HJFPF1_04487 [Paramyrothecium foliicola]